MAQTVVLAMSGGVDSSVAALLLLEQGFRVVGVTLRLYDACSNAKPKTCCGLEDAYDARAVAAKLGIEHRVLEHQEAFRALVIQPFVQAYAEGRTPNPCIACNEKVKFGTLWEYAASLGADAVATGHHARLVALAKGVELRRGKDLSKDQSYVLFPLTLEQRRRTLLPVGEWTKAELRGKARTAGLPTAEKEESQDICFVGRGHYSDFLAGQLGAVRPGAIRGEDGSILGYHQGIHHFTVGQRQGLGIPASHPLYVKSIDASSGDITVGPKDSLRPRRFEVESWHWHCPADERPDEADVQVRYHQVPRRARLVEGGRTMVLEWLEGPQSVTPGQAAVAYRGDVVLGGGWISGSME
jgi:tRNA-specific 2-thiouridylase